MSNMKKPRGFIALISVIVISAVLLGLVSVANTSSFFSREIELNGEYKNTANALADACVQTALLQLDQNYVYAASNVVVPVGNSTCTLVSVSTTAILPTNRTVQISALANYKNSYTAVTATALIQNTSVSQTTFAPDVTLVSWQTL